MTGSRIWEPGSAALSRIRGGRGMARAAVSSGVARGSRGRRVGRAPARRGSSLAWKGGQVEAAPCPLGAATGAVVTFLSGACRLSLVRITASFPPSETDLCKN